jgi:GxxExxY protein
MPIGDRTSPEVVAIARDVVDAAYHVHSTLGPGLLESVHEACLEHELRERGHECKRQLALPVHYRGIRVESGFRIDRMVDDLLLIEVIAVDQIHPIHKAQIVTYLKLTQLTLGLLINFNVNLIRDGFVRVPRFGPSA